MYQQKNLFSPAPIVFWIVWSSILFGVFMLQFFIIGEAPSSGESGVISNSTVAICLSGVVMSTLVRWLILPHMKTAVSKLPVMMIGLALAEATGILGIFIIGSTSPDTQMITFVLSVLGIVQYIPVYASK